MSNLVAVTAWGREASSPRVRLHEWLARREVRCDTYPYAGLPTSSPRQLLSHPAGVLRGEIAIRRLTRDPPERLLLLREASPLSRGAVEARLLRNAGFGVYDFDDALQWDLGDDHGLYRRLAPKAPKAVAAVVAADRVIAGNETLADWASGHNGDVVVIPTCVDIADYETKTEFELSDPPRLGWIGSPNNEEQLLLVAAPLLEVHRRTGARLTLVSGAVPTVDLGPLASMTDRVAWSVSAQRTQLRRFDIGIMPLRDTAYERGKCGYKLLQYGAATVPFIGSPVGVNRDILRAAEMPAPVSSDDWVHSLASLLGLPADARREAAQRAAAAVRDGYSYEVWADRWFEAVGLA